VLTARGGAGTQHLATRGAWSAQHNPGGGPAGRVGTRGSDVKHEGECGCM
jgi:hypothetical protein